MYLIKKFFNSLAGQFIIGGLTVSGISAFSNQLGNPILAGIIASIPIGMPSTVFVKNNQIESYTWTNLVLTSVLVISTMVNYYLINHAGYDKYQSVEISMGIWTGLGIFYYLIAKFMNWK
ncbi:hypothetical protein N9P79_00660 [Crocinitomicaceae bacterium]|nr:hypothetical protein [Crocinitomicaceae bacterium]